MDAITQTDVMDIQIETSAETLDILDFEIEELEARLAFCGTGNCIQCGEGTCAGCTICTAWSQSC